MTRENYIRLELDSLFRSWLARASQWGALLFLSLSALDYLVMPAQFRTFLVYRLVVSALLLVTGAVVSRTRSQEVCGLLGFVAVLASASTIEAMILKSGGHASPYYVGMILLATCVLGFIPTRPRLHVGFALAVYLTYVVPIVLTDDLQDWRAFITSNFFMVTIVSSALVLRYVSARGIVEQIGLRYDLQAANTALRRSEGQFRTLVNSTEDSIYLVDRDHRYVFANTRHLERLGLTMQECIGRAYAELHQESASLKFNTIVDRVLATGDSEREEFFSEKERQCFLRTFSPVVNAAGEAEAVIVVSADISEQKRMEEELRSLSLTDPLTGLLNRRGLFAVGEHLLKQASRTGEPLLLIYADVDDLKRINDEFGHREGDRALSDAARLLVTTYRDSDMVGRIGGDEFVVVAASLAGANPATITARLQSALDGHNSTTPVARRLSLSIGSVRFDPASPCSFEELLTRGDRLMYEAKRRKKAA